MYQIRSFNITGQSLYYYVVCKRKLYLSYIKVRFEHNSELIKIGKYLHEQREQERKDKGEETELLIDSMKLDSIKGDYVIEYKKKNSDLEATKAQLLYYLYMLKQKGVTKKGILKFKESKKDIYIELDEENERYVINLIKEIEELLLQEEIPPVINKPKCKNCAFYEFCYS